MPAPKRGGGANWLTTAHITNAEMSVAPSSLPSMLHVAASFITPMRRRSSPHSATASTLVVSALASASPPNAPNASVSRLPMTCDKRTLRMMLAIIASVPTQTGVHVSSRL